MLFPCFFFIPSRSHYTLNPILNSATPKNLKKLPLFYKYLTPNFEHKKNHNPVMVSPFLTSDTKLLTQKVEAKRLDCHFSTV